MCQHPKADAINAALVAGASPLDLAQAYGLTDDSLRRHRAAHLPAQLVADAEAAQAATASALYAQIKGLQSDARRLMLAAEGAADYRSAVNAVRELSRLVEILARLAGKLNDGANITINLHTSPEWVKLRTSILAALLPYPEAQAAVLAAIGAQDAGR